MKNNTMTSVAVIMCTYRRIDRLSHTLDQLSKQTNCNINLFIWNNNPEYISAIRKIAKQYPALSIKITNSKKNVGGFGRFYYARRISHLYSAIVFIDDDIEMTPQAISILLSEFRPKTIHSFYAYKFITEHNYYKRKNLKPGDKADYCGTGGMICDSSIFADEELYKCPEEFWFIEDLWLSYYTHHICGWDLYKSASPITLHIDGKDQWTQLGDNKTKFLKYLIMTGWDMPHINNKYSVTHIISLLKAKKRSLVK